MSVTIVECNSKQDTSKSIESSWTNVFQKPIEIGTGDSLQIRNTFINTIAGASGNIIIDNDIECVLEMGYYVIFSDDIKSDVEWNGTALDPEYSPWIARKSNAEPFLKELKFTVKKGVYTPTEMASLLTRKFSSIPHQDLYDDLNLGNVFIIQATEVVAGPPVTGGPSFYRQDGASGSNFSFKGEGTTEKPGYWVGAYEPNVIFNQDEDQKFRMNLHSPMTDTSSAHVEVQILKDYIQDRLSGVFFTKLEPKTFWEDVLHFDVDNILIKFDPVTHIIQGDLIELTGVCTTGGSIGLANLPSQGSLKQKFPHTSNIEATNTTAIKATSPLDLLSAGYYLISVTPFTKDYHESTQTRTDIQCIVSRQYIMSNFVTGFSDSSIPWVNRGKPFLLSQVKVEILDAQTKQPAQDLGKANAIFLEVVRNQKNV